MNKHSRRRKDSRCEKDEDAVQTHSVLAGLLPELDIFGTQTREFHADWPLNPQKICIREKQNKIKFITIQLSSSQTYNAFLGSHQKKDPKLDHRPDSFVIPIRLSCCLATTTNTRSKLPLQKRSL